MAALPAGMQFEPLMVLYLTAGRNLKLVEEKLELSVALLVMRLNRRFHPYKS